jgi:muramoyltetrapeptide carboxypeptidase LdcA involved in peptidoglycan recycling
MGVIDRIAGLLLGRARDHTDQEKLDLEATVRSVIADELDRPDLPILANLDFGHTDPQWVLPIGATAELDLERRTLTLLEHWLAE